jgi:uncharacterized iron-regulated protein
MRPWMALATCLCLVSCAFHSETKRAEALAGSDEQFWQAVEKANVVYVGETHDDPLDHQYELELVRGLLKRKTKFAIGWEMFDTTQQSAIDAWTSHAISFKEMMSKTDFQKHWGIYSPVYGEILRIAGNADIPILALNAPPELTRKIARGEPLTAKEKAMVPTGFVATEGGYKNFVAMMGAHPGLNEADQRLFFAAQNAWDQTMASRILDFELRNPEVQLLVLTGRGHVSGGYGIPFYVSQKAHLNQLIVLPRKQSVSAGAERIGVSPYRRIGEEELALAFIASAERRTLNAER